MFFSKERRAQIVAENPGLAFGEIGKKVGEAWKALPAEERAPFDAQAAADKERFVREDRAYKASKTAGDAEPASDGEGDEEAEMEE